MNNSYTITHSSIPSIIFLFAFCCDVPSVKTHRSQYTPINPDLFVSRPVPDVFLSLVAMFTTFAVSFPRPALIHAIHPIFRPGIRDNALAAVKSSDTRHNFSSKKLYCILVVFSLAVSLLVFVTCKNNVKSGC